MLTVEGLAVSAGGVALLRDVTVNLDPGELVAVIGPSGCGKTTLLRAIAGLEDPGSGRVLLEGRTPDELGWPAYRRRVVLVEQQPVVLPGSVRDNLARPFTYRTARGEFPEDRARELLRRLDVGEGRLAQEAESLSVGQQQRVALVRALLIEPSVLLLDEPTSALDADAAKAVGALLCEEAASRGLAALVVTHDPTRAAGWCSRRLELSPLAESSLA